MAETPIRRLFPRARQTVAVRRPVLANALVLFLFLPLTVQAWGERGHGAVGVLAVEQLSDEARERLAGILGSTELDDVVGACNWPDVWRDMGDGSDTASWHYVNIDPDENAYAASRDCPGGQCVTAQITAHAERLGDGTLPRGERRRAFKYVCHLVGDLHQPLHVGYEDDEGGNRITIRYRGQSMNLHRYWDLGLLDWKVDSLGALLELLRERPDRPPRSWRPSDVRAWTNESFALTRNFAYPPTRTVDEDFEEMSWRVTRQQLDAAAGRLAVMLETVLAEPGH